MAKGDRRKPTDGELEILGVLWDQGPSTVRDVYRQVAASRDTGYTTVLKLMQIMTGKGLLVRDTTVRPQVYRPAESRRQMQGQLLRDLLDRVFSGSPGNLVLQALSAQETTREERQEIRALLERLEREGNGDEPA